MADTSSLCPTDGLNQKFVLVTDERGRKSVRVSDTLTEEDLSSPILIKVNVDDMCTIIYEGSDGEQDLGLSFAERVNYFFRTLCLGYQDTLTHIIGVCHLRIHYHQ